MYDDFKECIIRLMQHPITQKPVSELTDGESQVAYDLLIDMSLKKWLELVSIRTKD